MRLYLSLVPFEAIVGGVVVVHDERALVLVIPIDPVEIGVILLAEKESGVPPPLNPSTKTLSFRKSLPAYSFREQILQSIERHQVTFIAGGTGCGKTTQVPQFLLDDASSRSVSISISCTQRRRLPAIAVSKRVAEKRGEKLATTVGYHIRLDKKTGPDALLTYFTSGVLLRQLVCNPSSSNYTIILNEVHEHEQCTDCLLNLLRETSKQRPDLRLVLMSATMQGHLEKFQQYFDGLQPNFMIPGRMYHVEKFPLEEVLAMPKIPDGIRARDYTQWCGSVFCRSHSSGKNGAHSPD